MRRLPLLVSCFFLALSACATFATPRASPSGPPACEAWRAAELAWVAVDAYMRQTLEAERMRACLPEPVPAPVAPPVQPEMDPAPEQPQS